MRILLYLDNLRVGGAQHSTIDLAVGLEQAGHEVTLAAGPGPLEAVADERGVRRVAIAGATHPGLVSARALAAAVDRCRPDVVYALGPLAAIEAVAGAGFGRGVPVVCGYPSDHLPPDAPRSTPVVTRRPAVLRSARDRNPVVADIPVAVDTTYNHPGVDGTAFRQEHGAGGSALVVLVSRLSREQKEAGIVTTIAAAGVLASRRVVRLVVVGDGSLRPEVEAAAERDGGGVVRFAGELADPRPACAAADVVLGLGTSLLRAMAQARPAIALGSEGQAQIVEAASVGGLVETGWLAPGRPTTPEGLADLIEALLDDADRARACGDEGRQAVMAERGYERVAELMVPVFAEAIERRPARVAVSVDAVRSWVGWWVRRHGGRLWRRVRFRLRRWSG